MAGVSSSSVWNVKTDSDVDSRACCSSLLYKEVEWCRELHSCNIAFSVEMDYQFASAAPVAFGMCLTALATIITQYIWATSLGHVEYWMPTISQCSQGDPEKFLFRVVMIAVPVIMFRLWGCIEAFTKYYKNESFPGWIKALTTIGPICLMGSTTLLGASVHKYMNYHVGFAMSFFLLTVIAMSYVSWKLFPATHFLPAICLLAYAIIVADLVTSLMGNSAVSNLCEWLLTGTILIWFGCWGFEFSKHGVLMETNVLGKNAAASETSEARYKPLRATAGQLWV